MQIGLSLLILAASLEFSYGLKCFSCTYNVDSDGKVKEIDSSKKCKREGDNHPSIDCPAGQICFIIMGWDNELRYAIRGCKVKKAEDKEEEICDLDCVTTCVCGTDNCNRRQAVFNLQPQCKPTGYVYDYYEENDLPRPSTKAKGRKGKKGKKYRTTVHAGKGNGGSRDRRTIFTDIWTTLSSFIFVVYFLY